MSNAQNGARIKAWAGKGVGSGLVKNITFDGFVETNVDNPVVIDQCYETSADDCAKYPSNTYIQDIFFTECVSALLSADRLISVGSAVSLGRRPGRRRRSWRTSDARPAVAAATST